MLLNTLRVRDLALDAIDTPTQFNTSVRKEIP